MKFFMIVLASFWLLTFLVHPFLKSSLSPNDIKALKVEMEADEGYFSAAMQIEGPHSRRDEYTVIHLTTLWGGLLLPFLHPLFLDIVQFWGVPLAQFVPSSIRMIVAFIATYHLDAELDHASLDVSVQQPSSNNFRRSKQLKKVKTGT